MEKKNEKSDKKSKILIILMLVVAIIISIICIFINYEGNNNSRAITGIKSFHLGLTGIAYRSHDFVCNERVCYDDSNEYDKEKIIDLLNKYHVREWNGFNKNKAQGMVDADGFDLKIVLDDNTTIKAKGYRAYPKKFHGFREEILKIMGKSY